ncbi:unnamed protein product [Durusdinium trenchii]|uniref:Fe2OG dioxygenase domain-containing protein n=1 Tax=Durusdinium trenchii TaxID=1381693 RepID=A0ABP0PX60_9DINO
MLRFVLLAVCAAQELHILSKVPETVQVHWLPGGDAKSHPSGELEPAGEEASSFIINTYAGHSFRFQAGTLSSKPVTHSGGAYDLVKLSPGAAALTAELVTADQLHSLVGEMYSHCRERDSGYIKCCHDFLNKSRGIPPFFADKYMNAFSPHRLMPRVAGRGDFKDSKSHIHNLDDDGYGGSLPPDEMVVLNNMPIPVELHWAYAADASDLASDTAVHDTTLITDVGSKSFVRITGHPGQSFLAVAQHTRQPVSKTALFRYPSELFVVMISESSSGKDAKPDVAIWDQDELKIILSEFAKKCGDRSHEEQSFMECLKQTSSFPPALTALWFQLLWTSLQHWRHCVYLPDTAPLRHITLELHDGSGRNRSVKAQVLREKPFVVGIAGFATAEECKELITSQELETEDLAMAFITGGAHSKSRRTLTRNLYPTHEAPGSIFAKLYTRFFQAARGASGYDLWPEGQEPVNWLHYKPGYEYRPHCDGGCGYDPVTLGARVASSLLYCNVAEQGGSTIFTKDTTKFTPAKGDFLFFAYKHDPDFMSMHAACPVLKGVKSTATQWYREGVSADYTWEHVQDLGQSHSPEL